MSFSRLEVHLSDRLSERLELLASSEGLTKTDVFRRVLPLYLRVKEWEEGGIHPPARQGRSAGNSRQHLSE